MNKIILASASPRRRELLELLGLTFETIPGDIDESQKVGEGADILVRRLAHEKAAQISQRYPEALVIGADTVVAMEPHASDGDILGKPTDSTDAQTMLRRLSGRSHFVTTAIFLSSPARGISMGRVVVTEVIFRSLAEIEIERYISTGEPLDKAGAYGIQGQGGMFVRSIVGSYTNVVGLPLVELEEELSKLGVCHYFPCVS